MLSKEATALFIGRNKDQGRVLTAALKRHHQKIFEEPQIELRHLRRTAEDLFMAGNAYARNRVLQMVGGHVCDQLGATEPSFELRRRAFFLTIADRACVRTDKVCQWQAETGFWDDDREPLSNINLEHPIRLMMDRYRSVLPQDGSCIAMMEPAIYVSSTPHVSFSPTFNYHVHAICWDTTGRQMRRICKRINRRMKPLLPYTTAAHYSEIRSGDILQMLWYMTKMPRKQYQIWVRPTGRPKSFKRAINGVNSVRLYADLRDVPLECLLAGHGAGQNILKAVVKEITASRTASLADPIRSIIRYRQPSYLTDELKL